MRVSECVRVQAVGMEVVMMRQITCGARTTFALGTVHQYLRVRVRVRVRASVRVRGRVSVRVCAGVRMRVRG